MDVREKLIEILKTKYDHFCDQCGINKDSKYTENLVSYLIANGVRVQEWISVDDRLPKDWTDVLVSSRFGFLETAVYTGTPGKWRVCWNGDMLEADSITHWMPLPRPSKGE